MKQPTEIGYFFLVNFIRSKLVLNNDEIDRIGDRTLKSFFFAFFATNDKSPRDNVFNKLELAS